jgi:thiol-disulfide isomerase/thioredoxin
MKTKIWNTLTLVILIYLGSRVAMNYWQDSQYKGKTGGDFSAQVLNSDVFHLSKYSGPLILVFWATWCGPCDVELARIKRMIQNNEISKESVLAVSVQETAEVVQLAASERGYHFPIGLDQNGEIAHTYKVSGTPTILFLNRDRQVAWRTTGISPSLGFRIRSFLDSQN